MNKIVLAVVMLAMISLTIPQAAQSAPAVSPSSTRFSLGLGFGTMYGNGGANVEYHIDQQFSATAGLGLNGGGNWFAGGRYYLKPEGSGIRARVTLGLSSDECKFYDTNHGPTKLIFAVGGSMANADNGFRGFDFDLTTNGNVSVGYHF